MLSEQAVSHGKDLTLKGNSKIAALQLALWKVTNIAKK